MNQIRRGVHAACVAIVLAGASGAPAELARAETPSALLRCVQDRYGALRDLSATFVQESRVASLGRTRIRAGRLFFQAPGRMRWEYDGPEPQLIVADGKQLWFHRPERSQVVVQPMDAAFTRQTPLLFLLGRGDFAAEFSWDERELAPGAGGLVNVALRPRAEAPDLSRLVLEVAGGECRLAGTIVEDAFGNVTHLVFSGERANTGLDAGLFRFAPPKGTEVVRP
ncbi:MAG: LolA family protein [Candidatus Methylomirabilia bacterium]